MGIKQLNMLETIDIHKIHLNLPYNVCLHIWSESFIDAGIAALTIPLFTISLTLTYVAYVKWIDMHNTVCMIIDWTVNLRRM